MKFNNLKLRNPENIGVAGMFIQMFGPLLGKIFSDRGDLTIDIRILPDDANEYKDIVARLGRNIYISPSQCGAIGLTNAEIMASIAHEIGHIMYGSMPFGFDAEFRADSLAFELGLGVQMMGAIDKIIASHRYRHITGQLVQRLQMLGSMEHEQCRKIM